MEKYKNFNDDPLDIPDLLAMKIPAMKRIWEPIDEFVASCDCEENEDAYGLAGMSDLMLREIDELTENLKKIENKDTEDCHKRYLDELFVCMTNGRQSKDENENTTTIYEKSLLNILTMTAQYNTQMFESLRDFKKLVIDKKENDSEWGYDQIKKIHNKFFKDLDRMNSELHDFHKRNIKKLCSGNKAFDKSQFGDA